MMIPHLNNNIMMRCGIIVTEKSGNPCIELRKVTTDMETIKSIINCAFEEKPMVIFPSFSNKLRAISSLTEKGIIYMKKDQYYFVL